MLLRDKYLLKNLFGFFLILLVSISILLLIVQTFWSLADTKHTGIFPWRDWLVNFYESFQIVFPFITLLSAFFVFSELEKFKNVLIFKLNGISELQIFRTFLLFGFFCSFFSFIAGCFSPYSSISKNNSVYPLTFSTDNIFLWIEKYEKPYCFKDVLFNIRQNNSSLTFYSKKAEFLKNKIVFYDGTVSMIDKQIKKDFKIFEFETDFNPLTVIKYLTLPIERLSFFKLNKILKEMSYIGIKSNLDWIILYSKISYPLLNFFIIMLLIPFFLLNIRISRPKIFIVAFFMVLFTYALYSAGISLGKADIIPWQISPWLSHFLLSIFFVAYLAYSRKKMYN